MGYDSFFADKQCPKCKKFCLMEFQTQAFGSLMNEFHSGQKIKQNGLEMWDGEAKASATCPKCHANLKGNIWLRSSEFRDIVEIAQT